mmetsp:Transcript_47852/g.133255  ORF Transcript_47852/g.133255 Transcript_47852/m.133255 type:complete len:290 (+) Transcript_47852:149-1018(+)
MDLRSDYIFMGAKRCENAAMRRATAASSSLPPLTSSRSASAWDRNRERLRSHQPRSLGWYQVRSAALSKRCQASRRASGHPLAAPEPKAPSRAARRWRRRAFGCPSCTAASSHLLLKACRAPGLLSIFGLPASALRARRDMTNTRSGNTPDKDLSSASACASHASKPSMASAKASSLKSSLSDTSATAAAARTSGGSRELMATAATLAAECQSASPPPPPVLRPSGNGACAPPPASEPARMAVHSSSGPPRQQMSSKPRPMWSQNVRSLGRPGRTTHSASARRSSTDIL